MLDDEIIHDDAHLDIHQHHGMTPCHCSRNPLKAGLLAVVDQDQIDFYKFQSVFRYSGEGSTAGSGA